MLYLRNRPSFGRWTSLWEKKYRQYDSFNAKESYSKIASIGGDLLGSVVKKRRKKMRKHKHRKLLAKTRHQRRKR